MVDAWPSADAHDPGFTRDRVARIDYVVVALPRVSGNAGRPLLGARTHDVACPSDHDGVVADLLGPPLGPEPGVGPPD